MMTIVSWNCSWGKGGFNRDKLEYIVKNIIRNMFNMYFKETR
jgi:hypothetical protein